MRLRSLLTLLGICTVFALVQGWIFLENYWFPITLTSSTATIVGTVVDVGSPVAGRVEEVYVFDAQKVRAGEKLFLMTPQSQDHPFGGVPMEISAPRAGTIARISVVPGSFVQASEVVGQVIDLSPDSLLVDTAFKIDPQDHYRIRAFLPAAITAPFLPGKPVDGIVTAVEPIYDAEHGTVRVKIRITGAYPSKAPLASGLPVRVSIVIPNENSIRDGILRIAHRIIPSSFAH